VTIHPFLLQNQQTFHFRQQDYYENDLVTLQVLVFPNCGDRFLAQREKGLVARAL